MTSKRRMEGSEPWEAVGHIEAGQSITYVAVLFGIHHCVISRLWKLFQTTQAVFRRPVTDRRRVTTPTEHPYISILDKRNHRATSTRVTSMVTASIFNFFFFFLSISQIKRGTIKVVLGTFQMDSV